MLPNCPEWYKCIDKAFTKGDQASRDAFMARIVAQLSLGCCWNHFLPEFAVQPPYEVVREHVPSLIELSSFI